MSKLSFLLQGQNSKKGLDFKSVIPTPLAQGESQISNLQDEDDDDDDDDDDDEDDSDEDDSDDSNQYQAKTKTILKSTSKDLDWSQEEQQNVMRYYGLEMIFPTVWGEDIALQPTVLTPTPAEPKPDESSKKIAAIHEEDTSDPLKIKGKIKRPKWMKTKPNLSIFISDKHFDAKSFLTEVHKNTDYKELEQGALRLKQSIAERNDTTKGLIKKHFAKFVNAKSTVDSFYKEMRAKNLIANPDYGIAPFLRQLSDLKKDANALYGPVLERRAKADKIRITISILEQWKFFFNLASSMSEMVRKGQFEAAIRDYKRGKHIMQSSFDMKGTAKEAGKVSKFGKDDSNLLPKHYQNVFEKLWVEVVRVVADFREELFHSLRIVTNPIETQERIILYLTELDSRKDPVWCYMDTQYTWVMETLVAVYTRYMISMRDIIRKLRGHSEGDEEDADMNAVSSSVASLDNLLSTDYLNMIDQKVKREEIDILLEEQIHESVAWGLDDIKKAMSCITTGQFESQFGKEVLVCFWKQTLAFVVDICRVLDAHLPLFWRTCKLYFNNKRTEYGRKVTPAQKLIETETMLKNIFSILDTMLKFAFFLDVEQDNGEEDEDFEEMDFENSVASLPGLKSLKDYQSNAGLQETDMQSVQQIFEKISSSITRLPLGTFSILTGAHPLVILHYGVRIMEAFEDFSSKLNPFCFAEDGVLMKKCIQKSVDTIKCSLVERVSSGWVKVVSNFHMFEDWRFENHQVVPNSNSSFPIKSDSTSLMILNHKLNKLTFRSLALIIFGTHTGDDMPDFEANHAHTETVRTAFIDGFFGILDGYEYQVAHWRDLQGLKELGKWGETPKNKKLNTILPEAKYKFGQFVAPDCSHFVETVKAKDFKNIDVRSFMVLCNIEFLLGTMLTNASDIFKEKFDINIDLDAQHFNEISRYLKRLIIMNYAKRQNEIIHKLVKYMVFYSGLDWASLKSPIAIRPHCLQLLQHLILVHAALSEVSVSLVPLVFSEILLFLAQEMLMAFRQVDRFNISGMLQATLEAEFIDSTLKAFETPNSSAIFTQIYEIFERNADPDEQIEPELMHEHLLLVKTHLDEAKISTSTQFRCFITHEETALK